MEDIQSLQKLYLLGTPRFERDGLAVPISRRKSLALLAFLTVTAQPQARDSLLAFLWPDYDSDTARKNLRRDLSGLRRIVGKEFLPGDSNQLSFTPDAGMWVDVLAFRELLAAAAAHKHETESLCLECIEWLSEAVALYGNDFMAGFGLSDASAFDDWQYYQASALRHELGTALKKLLAALKTTGRFDTALPYARRWLALDPLHEPAQRELMQLLTWSGQPAEALAQFEASRALLQAELGVEPEEATLTLIRAIRERRLTKPGAVGAKMSPAAESVIGPAESIASGRPAGGVRHNLPAQTTPFIGREQELADLADLLADPAKRLITIVAPGGMGKTRLALAAAEGQRTGTLFPQGIYFVSLAPISDPTHIVPTLAEVLRFPMDTGEGSARPPRQQIVDFLRQKQILLIMDNFEHLLDGAELVSDLLREAPGVQILATSRERLHLLEEQLFGLGGLELPDEETLEDGVDYAAAKLFVQSAGRINHQFRPTDVDLVNLSRICRLVGGMPLAVELAASWVDTLSLGEIAAEIQRNIDFLATELRNVPERQRSLRAVFDAAWNRLGEVEQALLGKLAIFRGGFSRSAAQVIAGASLRSLFHLVSKALLQYDLERERYQVHEMLRQYAAERLANNPEKATATCNAHAIYYLEALADRENKLKGHDQQKALQEIEADFENVRAAWAQAILAKNLQAVRSSMYALGHFCELKGRFQDGVMLFQLVTNEHDGGDQLLRAGCLVWLAVMVNMGQGEAASSTLLTQAEFAIDRLPASPSADQIKASLIFERARALMGQDYQLATQAFHQSLAVHNLLQDSWAVARCLHYLGEATRMLGRDYLEAYQYLAESIALNRKLGDPSEMALATLHASATARYLGRREEALALGHECLSHCRQLGNDRLKALGLRNLALCHNLGWGKTVRELLIESLTLCENLGNSLELALARIYLGASYLDENKNWESHKMAQALLEAGLEVAENQGASNWVAFALLFLSGFAILADKLEEGVTKLTRAKHIFQTANNREGANSAECLKMVALSTNASVTEHHSGIVTILQEGLERTSFVTTVSAIHAIAALIVASKRFDADESRYDLECVKTIHHCISHNRYWISQTHEVAVYAHLKNLAAEGSIMPAGENAPKAEKMDVWQLGHFLIEQLSKSNAPMNHQEPLKVQQTLPISPTPLLGRAEELATLTDHLHNSTRRLISIVGPGGIGKTRLALALAQEQLHAGGYTHGVFFVPLASLSEPDQILPALADALGFPLEAGGENRRTPRQQILDYLRQKNLLLILDNFEHLLEGAELVSDMLQEAPDLHIVVTSRERLYLQEEQLFPLKGLALPDRISGGDPGAFPSIQLFVDTARRIRPDFSPQPVEVPHLIQICQLVDGLPLGLELAAGWIDLLSLQDIVAEIEQSLDFLASDLRNIPERHRSLRAVFSASLDQLGEQDQVLLPHLSIFQGGFSRWAAEAVAGASLRQLGRLASKSLLTYNREQDRYQMHELLRQHAAELLALNPADEKAIREGHSRYYLKALADREPDLQGSRQQEILREIEADIGNVRLAWDWGVSASQSEFLMGARDTLCLFYYWQGRFEDGAEAMELVRSAPFVAQADPDLLGLALIDGWLSNFYAALGQRDEAKEALARAFEMISPIPESKEQQLAIAFFCQVQGQHALYVDNHKALASYQQATAINRRYERPWGLALCLRRLGEAHWQLGQYEQAHQALNESIDLFRELGDRRGLATALLTASSNARYNGQHQRAVRLAEECLEVSQTLSNPYHVAWALRNLGQTVSAAYGQHRRAMELVQQSREIFVNLANPHMESISLFSLAHMQGQVGLINDAISNARQGSLLAEERKQPHWQAQNLYLLGRLIAISSGREEGLRFVEESHNIWLEMGNIDGIQVTRFHRMALEIGWREDVQLRQETLSILSHALQRRAFFILCGALDLILPLLHRQGIAVPETRPQPLQLALEILFMLENQWAEPSIWTMGRSIAALKRLIPDLPPEMVQSAKKRGEAMDWWAMGEYLLAELPTLGWVTD